MTTEQQRTFLPDLCTSRAVLVVVVGGQLFALVLVLAASYYRPFSWEFLGLLSFFVQWVGLTSAALLCLLRLQLEKLPQNWSALAVVLVVTANTIFFSLMARYVVEVLLGGGGTLWSVDVLVNGAIAAMIASMVMRYFFVQEQWRHQSEAVLRANIQALQSRIRPHFLFNSMNIISSLIETDPRAAEQAVEDLSRLFRASLQLNQNQVPLSDELALCKRFVRIEQLRMGSRLRVHWDICCEPEQVLIPPLTLQPLVENAIYHGVQPLPDGGDVQVTCRREGGDVLLEIVNPVPLSPAIPQHKGNGMALENIRLRLNALYGHGTEVTAGPGDNRSYRVLIRYPLRTGGGK